MERKVKKRLSIGIPARFKLIRLVLFLMIISFLVNGHVSLKLIEGDPVFGRINIAPYFIFQINFLAIMVIVVLTLVWMLHYGFGALTRMENILEQVINGDYTFRMNLRKRDIMRPFAEKLNKVLDLLEKSKKFQ